jgi:hypothetical protein
LRGDCSSISFILSKFISIVASHTSQKPDKQSSMIKFLTTVLLLLVCSLASAQKPKDGTYTYGIAWDEWQGKTLGATCTVIIKGDSIRVIHNGKPNVTGKKGDVYAEGIIMKHKSGKWIIGSSPKDKNAKELRGCGDGPPVIDFKKKLFWSC